MAIQPGTEIGRYHILEQLGEGGMAVVYKAYDTRLENEVAIKVIRTGDITPNALPRILQRFSIEAKKMAQLTHPNIVPVIDYGEYEGSPYLVMRYLPGGTLKAKLGSPMAIGQAVNYLLPVARAIGYAHEKGLVHRDIKPSNILITEKDEPMLSDFGVAKVLDNEETRDLTVTGMGVGTPEYMAPEMGMSKDFDHRVDIYALGIVLYEMVTGRKPFVADTPIAVLFKHSSDPLPRPTQFNADIPEAFERVLFKALAKDPDARFQSMEELAGALKRFAGESRAAIKAAPAKTTRPSERIVPEEAPKEAKKKSKERKPFDARWLYGVLGAMGLGLIIFAGIKLTGGSEQSEEATPVDTTVFPDTATPGATATTAWTPTPALGIGSTIVSDVDGMTMVYVPAGEFIMGSEKENCTFSFTCPEHKVYLDSYWIDQTEVTNQQYLLCVEAGGCDMPIYVDTILEGRNTSDFYLRDQDHPIRIVNWYEAENYCQWVGRRLPTEAEWEKAARGTDGRTFPWGEEIDCDKVHYDKCPYFDHTTAVTFFGENGASPYGAYDMAGNVREWVSDWFDADYYGESPFLNPPGPIDGTSKVLRGGTNWSSAGGVTTTYRIAFSPATTNAYNGFRCATDAE